MCGGESRSPGPDAPREVRLSEQARRLAREHRQISASFLQRQLRIGYARAAQLMESLEQEGAEGGEAEKPPEGE